MFEIIYFSLGPNRTFILHNVISTAGCFHKASSSLFRSKTGTIHETIVQFSYAELENATNKFSNSNLIGVGGSSYVYCGQLKNGKTVAVKRLKSKGGPDADPVFLTEVLLNHAIPFNLFVFVLSSFGYYGRSENNRTFLEILQYVALSD